MERHNGNTTPPLLYSWHTTYNPIDVWFMTMRKQPHYHSLTTRTITFPIRAVSWQHKHIPITSINVICSSPMHNYQNHTHQIAFQWNQLLSQLISTDILHVGVSLVMKLTVWLTWLFPKTGCNIRLQFPQGRWLQSFKVNLNLIRVWIPQWRLSRLNDVHHSSQLVTYKEMCLYYH